MTAIGPIQGGQARLTVSLTEGGVFDRVPPTPSTAPEGEILLSFTSCYRGMVTYQLPGQSRQGPIPIQRVVTDNAALCEALASE